MKTERELGRNLVDARIALECYRHHRKRQGDYLGLHTEADLIIALVYDLSDYYSSEFAVSPTRLFNEVLSHRQAQETQ